MTRGVLAIRSRGALVHYVMRQLQIDPAVLQGKPGAQQIIVDNLEPAVLRGARSEGMLLAVLADGEFALLQPDAKVADGSRVS